MSRSYKKNPFIKDSTRKGSTYKSGKQIANRVVRYAEDIPGGGGYRKAYCSYNISDFAFRMDESELRAEWDQPDSFLRYEFRTYREAYRWWKKTYLAK